MGTNGQVFHTEDAVKMAFPGMVQAAVDIVTAWYQEESAIEDFANVDDFADFIYADIDNMLCAASDECEFEIVTSELRRIGLNYITPAL